MPSTEEQADGAGNTVTEVRAEETASIGEQAEGPALRSNQGGHLVLRSRQRTQSAL